MPSDAGTYYVKAYTSETSTYQSSESEATAFEIKKADQAIKIADIAVRRNNKIE